MVRETKGCLVPEKQHVCEQLGNNLYVFETFGKMFATREWTLHYLITESRYTPLIIHTARSALLTDCTDTCNYAANSGQTSTPLRMQIVVKRCTMYTTRACLPFASIDLCGGGIYLTICTHTHTYEYNYIYIFEI